MTSSSVESQIIGVIVTGRLGHRGVDAQAFLRSVAALKTHASDFYFSYCFSNQTDHEDINDIPAGLFDSIIGLEAVANEGLKPYTSSLVHQTAQISEGLARLPNTVRYVLRLRTDWLVVDAEKLAVTVRQSALLDRGLHIVSQSMSEFGGPLTHVPWFANDHMVMGAPDAMQKLWMPYSRTLLREAEGVKFFSRQTLVNQGVLCHPEQLLFLRFFDRTHFLKEGLTSWASVLSSSVAMGSLSFSSPFQAGVEHPEGVEGVSSFWRVIARILSKVKRANPSIFPAAVAYAACHFLFWASPSWWGPRVKYLLDRQSFSK